MKIGFIGTGVITEAVLTGLLASDYHVSDILLSRRSADISARLAAADHRVQITTNNQEIINAVDVVFLAVRPQVAEKIIRQLNFQKGQYVASLIATIPAETLQDWIGIPVQINRAIPLPAVANRRGITVVFPADEQLEGLFGALGAVVSARSLEEFDAYAAASALMGFYFAVMETAANWLEKQGTSKSNAQYYLSKVFLELALTADSAREKSFAELRANHSTPNGLNQQMVDVFTAANGFGNLERSLDNVAERIRDRTPGQRPTSCN